MSVASVIIVPYNEKFPQVNFFMLFADLSHTEKILPAKFVPRAKAVRTHYTFFKEVITWLSAVVYLPKIAIFII